jgi:hypothetical protein
MIACFVFRHGCLATTRGEKKKQRRTRAAQQRSERPGCNRWPPPLFPVEYFPAIPKSRDQYFDACKSFPLSGDLLFRLLHEKGAGPDGGAGLHPRAALTVDFLKSRRNGLLPALGNEPLCSCDGSVGLAAQESRGIENVFLDRIAHRRGAAVRIEAPRSRMARIFRYRLCRLPFRVAGRRA